MNALEVVVTKDVVGLVVMSGVDVVEVSEGLMAVKIAVVVAESNVSVVTSLLMFG